MINHKVREAVRQAAGREAQASAMIIDSQSAKSAEGGEKRGFDGGKKVSGRKRNLIVDTLGLLVLANYTQGVARRLALPWAEEFLPLWGATPISRGSLAERLLWQEDRNAP